MDDLKALIEHMAKALVDKPDAVSVQETDGEKTTIIELRVAQDDLGKVIGKQGRTARSMRTILNAAERSWGNDACWKSWNRHAPVGDHREGRARARAVRRGQGAVPLRCAGPV